MKIKVVVLSLLLTLGASSGVNAFWNNNGMNQWNNNWNPYNVWDPRYWMEEMEQTFYYGLKDFNNKLEQMDTTIDWGNSSYYKPE